MARPAFLVTRASRPPYVSSINKRRVSSMSG